MSLMAGIYLSAGDSRHCVAIIILEDQQPEMNENFLISVDGMGASTSVTIIDDDGNVTITLKSVNIPSKNGEECIAKP